MSSSPDSNASSSDLYSNSERAREDGSHQLIGVASAHSEPALYEGKMSHVQGVADDLRGLPESYMNGTSDHWTSQAASVLSPDGISTPNGRTISAYPKRKREDDDEVIHAVQRQPSHPGESDQGSSRTVSLDSVQQPSGQMGEPVDHDGSRIKRPRAENQEEPLSNGKDQSQPASLPAEVWQHVFSFVPPVFLGRLLRVNRAFHAYLTSSSTGQASHEPGTRNAIRPVSADEIWAASRKRFAPGLPKPTLGLNELERMRLLRGRQCQICGEVKVQNFATSSESPLEAGPGDKGVRVIWPFGIRSCGPCLHKCSEKVPKKMIERSCKCP